MAILLLIVGLGVVFLGAWLGQIGWTGWATPVLIAGALFVFGAGWAAMEIPHEVWREKQPLDQGPTERSALLTCGVLAAVGLALLIGALVWFGRADKFLPWFQ